MGERYTETAGGIEWPDSISAKPQMDYESIAPLYRVGEEPDNHMSFVASITDRTLKFSDERGCVHKLDIDFGPEPSNTRIRVSHEVKPKQGACSQIIAVNDKLRVACFDGGSIIPISNFGRKKTFNCHVRGRISKHCGPINCIASDSNGSQLASGGGRGEIALYSVRDHQLIDYGSRVNVCTSSVTGLGYLAPHTNSFLRPGDESSFDGENLLVYSTQMGLIGLLDTRCVPGQRIEFAGFKINEPRHTLTTLCHVHSLPGQVVFFGSAQGRLLAVDLRYNNEYLVDEQFAEDKCIRRMKNVSIQTKENETKSLLAYTNGTNEIKIIDPQSLETDSRWKCSRLPTNIVNDFCQLDEKIITCGKESSLGFWTYYK